MTHYEDAPHNYMCRIAIFMQSYLGVTQKTYYSYIFAFCSLMAAS